MTRTPKPAASTHAPPQCTAKTAKGNACKGKVIKGGTVCRMHGGSAPQVKEAARRRVQTQEAEKAAARYGIEYEKDEDPAEVLLSELRRSRALAAYWEHKLASDEVSLVSWSEQGVKMSVETELWQRERDRAINIATTCLKLGLEERRVRAAEQFGDALYSALEQVARKAGVNTSSPEGRKLLETGVRTFEATVAA